MNLPVKYELVANPLKVSVKARGLTRCTSGFVVVHNFLEFTL